MPRMTWRPLGICVLTVALGACSGSSPTEASGTVGTLPGATTVARSTAVSVAAPSTTADLGPGPTDAEIQQILDDTDAKVAEIFAAFKPGLVITPAIDKLIVEAFGPVADDMRDALQAQSISGGSEIQPTPRPARTKVRNVLSRSSLCAVVFVELDESPMLLREPSEAYLILRSFRGRWYSLGELTSEADLFAGRPCYVA